MSNVISVYNQTPMQIMAETKSDLYVFEPYDSGQNERDLTIEEIQYLNKNTMLFKQGYLTFYDKDKEEMYNELNLKADNIISREEIIDTIENPTKEKLQKLVDIQSLQVFQRVKFELVGLLSIPNNIINTVIQVIDMRYKELAKNQIRSDIEIGMVSVPHQADTQALQDEITKLKAQIKQMQKQQDEQETDTDNEKGTDENIENKTQSTRGRKPSATKK
jgi:hypothetical protein